MERLTNLSLIIKEYDITDDPVFHVMFDITKYYKHITKIPPSWCCILPPHIGQRKVNFKPPRSD